MNAHAKAHHEHYLEARNVTLIGAALDLALGIAKIVLGVFGHSQALLADGVHSLSDLVTDALVIWAVKFGSREADQEHPYGHERVQTIATVVLGIGLAVVAFGIGKSAVEGMLAGGATQLPSKLTLLVAFISIVSKEWIFRYTLRVAKKQRSKLLEANAWHSRSDALSSLIVLVGIAGALAGYVYLDSVAAIIVAAMVFKIGGELVVDGIKELIDTGIESEKVDAMMNTMSNVEGVLGVEELRTRRMGPTIVGDATVLVAPDISVSEGHRIAEEVERTIVDAGDGYLDFTVHIEPDDETGKNHDALPMRNELEQEVLRKWSAISSVPMSNTVLHYQNGLINVDLIFSSDAIEQVSVISGQVDRLRKELADIPHIGEITSLVRLA